jgi:hypothetical protein
MAATYPADQVSSPHARRARRRLTDTLDDPPAKISTPILAAWNTKEHLLDLLALARTQHLGRCRPQTLSDTARLLLRLFRDRPSGKAITILSETSGRSFNLPIRPRAVPSQALSVHFRALTHEQAKNSAHRVQTSPLMSIYQEKLPKHFRKLLFADGRDA